LSLEGRELKAKSSILRRHGRMTAKEESRKPKQEQGEGRHRPRFLGHMLMKVKPLSANRILANHRRLWRTRRKPISFGRLGCMPTTFGFVIEFGLPLLRAGSE
jgi:hypothetical protein